MAEKSCNNCGKESCDERCTSNTIRCTAWTPKKPEKVYLDKEAVLKAWEDTIDVPGTECMIKRVQRGVFDANVPPTEGPVWDNLNKALAEKDAEIARLNREILELQTALKALQEEVKCLVEGAPPKDPENWYKIDLGYPLKPIYIRKVQ
jgi:hypothetical protein